eukprot:6214261-Pleurochrysis_carterae.AAC.1
MIVCGALMICRFGTWAVPNGSGAPAMAQSGTKKRREKRREKPMVPAMRVAILEKKVTCEMTNNHEKWKYGNHASSGFKIRNCGGVISHQVRVGVSCCASSEAEGSAGNKGLMVIQAYERAWLEDGLDAI